MEQLETDGKKGIKCEPEIGAKDELSASFYITNLEVKLEPKCELEEDRKLKHRIMVFGGKTSKGEGWLISRKKTCRLTTVRHWKNERRILKKVVHVSKNLCATNASKVIQLLDVSKHIKRRILDNRCMSVVVVVLFQEIHFQAALEDTPHTS